MAQRLHSRSISDSLMMKKSLYLLGFALLGAGISLSLGMSGPEDEAAHVPPAALDISNGWSEEWISSLSSGDCKGIATGDRSWCTTRDCKGIASGDRSWCESRDCKGVASGDRSWCESKLCKAWASKDRSWCGSSDCKGVASGDRSWCKSKQCKAIATKDRSWCP